MYHGQCPGKHFCWAKKWHGNLDEKLDWADFFWGRDFRQVSMSFNIISLVLKVVQMLLRAGDEAKLEVKDREASASSSLFSWEVLQSALWKSLES